MCCWMIGMGFAIQKMLQSTPVWYAWLIFNIAACCLPCAWCCTVPSVFTASGNHHRWMLRPKWIFLSCRLLLWQLYAGLKKKIKLYYMKGKNRGGLGLICFLQVKKVQVMFSSILTYSISNFITWRDICPWRTASLRPPLQRKHKYTNIRVSQSISASDRITQRSVIITGSQKMQRQASQISRWRGPLFWLDPHNLFVLMPVCILSDYDQPNTSRDCGWWVGLCDQALFFWEVWPWRLCSVRNNLFVWEFIALLSMCMRLFWKTPRRACACVCAKCQKYELTV